MVAVRNGLSVGVLALVVLLGALMAGPGLDPRGWVVGVACGVALSAAVARGAVTARVESLGPADIVTLTRATLACGVAALVADSFVGDSAVRTLVVLAAVALALDAVDGRVARRTRTASAFGARLDGEADAFLMLALSVYAARTAGTWVVAMGAARYVFALAGWPLPWMRAQLPPRHWRKVATATAGIVLVFAASEVGPDAMTHGALALGFLLLAESFGRDVWWLWCRRPIEKEATRADVSSGQPLRQPST